MSQNIGYSCGKNDLPNGPTSGPGDPDGDEEEDDPPPEPPPEPEPPIIVDPYPVIVIVMRPLVLLR